MKKVILLIILLIFIVGCTKNIEQPVDKMQPLQQQDNSGETAPVPKLKDTTTSEKQFQKEGLLFSDTAINNLEVIKLDDGRYRMFYHVGNQIKSAISDDGKNFQMEPGIRLDGQMPATIRLPDGRWRMYFKNGPEAAGLSTALSDEGYNFKIEQENVITAGQPGSLDADGIIHPSIVLLDDGTFKLFYDGVVNDNSGKKQFHWTTLSASSTDGLHWVKDSGARINLDDYDNLEMVWSSDVIYDAGVYTMYITTLWMPLSKSGIYRATSTDGLNFKLDEKPVLSRSPQYGDNGGLMPGGPLGVPQDPFLLKTDQGERLFYWINEEGTYSAFR